MVINTPKSSFNFSSSLWSAVDRWKSSTPQHRQLCFCQLNFASFRTFSLQLAYSVIADGLLRYCNLRGVHQTCEKELQNYFPLILDMVSESSVQVINLVQMKDEIMLKKSRNLHIGCLPLLQYAFKSAINCFV